MGACFWAISFPQNPLPDVRGGVQHRDASRLAHVEKPNSFNIHEIDLFQIQSYWPSLLYLRFDLIKMLRSKLPAQSNPGSALVRYPFDLQRHEIF
jgi:hypothetical protein